MTENPQVRVTCFDPATGDVETQELDPNGYILILGKYMEISSLAQYANGTVQLTIKRRKEGRSGDR